MRDGATEDLQVQAELGYLRDGGIMCDCYNTSAVIPLTSRNMRRVLEKKISGIDTTEHQWEWIITLVHKILGTW